ncbi:9821_t:CDS:2 [Cetraspora pellucida]|uniref:9821_t:CDS:1 n=1 Tax=Cetraspora pellucida TaxID=1433469 RepID=A0A9N9DGL0_9GLOM|nr:9821_t:CDS:2 [Cetraspora pellucida]
MEKKLQSMMKSNSSTKIAIQESAQNSSFDVEADSTLLINNQISNDSSDLIPIQHTDSLLDEYSNSDEENDEQDFDTALTLLHEVKETSQSTNKHQFKINTKFKAAKKVKTNERFDKSAEDKGDECGNIQISQQNNIIVMHECDRLQSSNKMVNLSQTSNNPEFGEEIDALLPNSYSSINVTISTLQAVGINNKISIDNECIANKQQAENNGKLIEPILSTQSILIISLLKKA